MRLCLRYAAGLGIDQCRCADGTSALVSSVEFSPETTLLDLKRAVLGGFGALGSTGSLAEESLVGLALGTSPLAPPEGRTEAETSLQSLGVVQKDIVWVTSLPPDVLQRVRGGASPGLAAAFLPASVQRATGSDASVVRVLVAAAMASVGFDQVGASSTVYRLSTMEGEGGASVGSASSLVSVSVSSSVMASSCMLVGETRSSGSSSSSGSSTVARLVRFGGTSSLDERVSLYVGVIDGFCVPLMQACCRALGVGCPLETLETLPRELVEMIVERLPGREAPACLGLACKRLAAIVFDREGGVLYRRVLEGGCRRGPVALLGPGAFRQGSRQGSRDPLGGGMDRHIIGGAHDMIPGGGFGSLAPRGPTRSSQRWRL